MPCSTPLPRAFQQVVQDLHSAGYSVARWQWCSVRFSFFAFIRSSCVCAWSLSEIPLLLPAPSWHARSFHTAHNVILAALQRVCACSS